MTATTAPRIRDREPASAAEPVLRTTALVKRFGRTPALAGVDLELRPGEVLAYLGPNGAGKTTTIRILMGLVRPTSGSATVLGRDAWRDAHLVHRDVGYVPGEPAVGERFTGRQQLRWTARLRGLGDERPALAVADRLGLDLDRPARALSKGNRQKLALVLALVGRPRLLVLDEPTAGFDPLVQREFHALLRRHVADGGSALLSSHVLGEVEEVADRIAVLRAGRLVAVEDMAALRGRSVHRVRARFSAPVSVGDCASLPGVRDVAVDGTTLSCGAPATALDALLRRLLAGRRLVDLECTEAGLEQTFLALYGSAAEGPWRP